MSDALERIERTLEEDAPALFRLLSPLGHRAVFPPGIPFQAAEARGKRFNGTIGQITDGHGGAVPLPSLAAGLGALADDGPLGAAARNRALLYSPVEGMREVRELWRRRQRRDAPDGAASSLPQVVDGLTHALSIVADLFAGDGRTVVVPDPFWGNYRGCFEVRTGARLVAAPSYRDHRFDPAALAAAVDQLPDGEPAIVIANFPSNPGGYSPTAGERTALAASLAAAAERRPLLVVCDDAYAGLVFDDPRSDETLPRASLFWELLGRHDNLVPVKVDGATKELAFFGGRVGFLTFGFDPDSAAAVALESKVKFLLRATVGSPVAATQALVAQALGSPTLEAEIEAVRRLLAGRVAVLREALAACDEALLRPLPFNAGCFALVELTPAGDGGAGLDPEALRRHLLDHHEVGLVSIQPRYLRIAHCSVDAADLPELVRRMEAGARELAA
jgi:aspartate/methionine/tyrosine aminotransferase